MVMQRLYPAGGQLPTGSQKSIVDAHNTVVDEVERLIKRIAALEQQIANQALEIARHKERLSLPEIGVRQTHNPLTWREAAVRQEANTPSSYRFGWPQGDPRERLADPVPSTRGDVATIMALKAFAERFLAYDDLGQCVPASVRDDAREALGRARVES